MAKLRSIASSVQTTLIAEAQGQRAFIVGDKRYDVEKLLMDVSGLMAPGAFAKLPDIAQFDLSQAGRCVAFMLPTAGAFHLMRGTEATLRAFYESQIRRDRVSPLLWGPMTNHLRRRRRSPPEVLLNNLDNLRVSFRNPTQHPEAIYDIEEVQDLFGLSVDVMGRMVALMP